MKITHNFIQHYQTKDITNEALRTSKDYITNIANRILKYTPLITGMIQVGIVFSLAYRIEGGVLRDETPIPTLTLELDEVITVPLKNPIITNAQIICSLFSPLC